MFLDSKVITIRGLRTIVADLYNYRHRFPTMRNVFSILLVWFGCLMFGFPDKFTLKMIKTSSVHDI